MTELEVNNEIKECNNNIDEIKPVKKKRGRKPKSAKLGEEAKVVEPKKLKKRGRKPKNKFNVDANFNDYMNLSLNNQNHIIKIPLSCLDENNKTNNHVNVFGSNENTNDTEYNKNNNMIPQAYNNMVDIDNLEYNAKCDFYDGEKEFEQSIRHLLSKYFYYNKTPERINKYLNIIRNVVNDIENNNEHIRFDIAKLIPENKNNFSFLDKELKSSESSSNTVNNDYYDSKKQEIFNELNNNNLTQIEILINKKYRHTKQISLLNDVCHNVGESKWLQKTDCLCFWCSHKFDNIPWGIPTKYDGEKFTLTGLYCSPNCAMADLVHNEKNTNKLWEKIVLLNLLHHKIYGTDENIVPAPNKISLKAFGGPFDINEFRYLTLDNKKNYNITFPPCNIMAPILEETKKLTNQEHYFIPIDKNKANKTNSELKIRRRKAKHTENSLFNFTTKME